MLISESSWVRYITMIEQDWRADLLSPMPTWRRTNSHLREQEEMLMTKNEIEIWEKVHGMSIMEVRKIGKKKG